MQAHLANVYATLTAALLVAALGVIAEVWLSLPPVVGTVLAFGSLAWLAFTPRTPDNLVSCAVCARVCCAQCAVGVHVGAACCHSATACCAPCCPG